VDESLFICIAAAIPFSSRCGVYLSVSYFLLRVAIFSLILLGGFVRGVGYIGFLVLFHDISKAPILAVCNLVKKKFALCRAHFDDSHLELLVFQPQ